MIGKKGKDIVSIPLPFIDIPHFSYGHKEQGGVGQGEGEVGQPLGPGQVQPGRRARQAGQGRASTSSRSTSRSRSWPQILGEELELPRIEPRGKEKIVTQKIKYTGITPPAPSRCATSSAPTSRRCKRQIALGHLRPGAARSSSRSARTSATARYKLQNLPETNAVIIYMMDVSGSMTDEQKEIVRIEASGSIPGCATSTRASRPATSSTTRWRTRWTATPSTTPASSGGTMISSAYKLCREHHRGRLPAARAGTSTPSTSPTATTGARTTPATASSMLEERHAAAA